MIQAICWVLIHSLWQGVLLALAGGGVILCTRRSAAAMRYRLLCGLGGAFLCGIGFTFIYEWAMAADKGGVDGGVGVSMNWFSDWCSGHAVQVVAAWLIVTMFKSFRMAAGLSFMRRMRREGLAAPALCVDRVAVLSRRLGIGRTVKLVESVLVRVPVVIGQLRPIIYIPLGLVNHLPASEMEAVLLHELAHIRRYDHLVNMVQQAVECLLFFNPGFLWISSLIREERENSCDDIAIMHTRDRVGFVRALVRFKEHSMYGAALAFPGNKQQLLHRVLRIYRQENKTLSGKERLVLLGGCLVLLCLLAARAARPDMLKKTGIVVEARLAEVRQAEVQPLTEAPSEAIAVLRTREQVSQNIEWVKAQLKRLHRKSDIKKDTRQASAMEQDAKNLEQLQANREVMQNQEQAEGGQRAEGGRQAEGGQQVDGDRQADRDRHQAEKDREQADRDREQADRDQQQAEKDRAQADRDRQRGELDRIQAERDRQRAVQIKVEAELNRARAERDRDQAELNRQQADRERAQADQERQERDRAQALQRQLQADRDKEQAELARQQDELARRKTESDRQQAKHDGK